MKGTFRTSEVVCLLESRVPDAPAGMPQFRLQNFLMGKKTWKTRRKWDWEKWERGDVGPLREILGDRLETIMNIRKAHGNGHFATLESFSAYVIAVEKALGEELELIMHGRS